MDKSLQETSLEIFLSDDYQVLLKNIKARISKAQIKAAISVNRELIDLYWDIGKAIIEKQNQEEWGKGVIKQLSSDLQIAFPGVKGFSARNLWDIRRFYLTYEGHTKLRQLVAQIPWGHNLVLLNKIKIHEERIWYLNKIIENGWSRNVLVLQIESGLYQRTGKAITNFKRTLPKPDSDLAQETLKDPYNFDFLTLEENAKERTIERALLNHIRDFLLELGNGFAFVGSQYHLEVSDRDFYIDLLFYHLKLRRYVVIELKATEFQPEFAGKMNFYLSAVDDVVRHSDDKSSIGIILCKQKDQIIVEYALRDTMKPIGVSEFLLTRELPPEIQEDFPLIDEFEKKLELKITE